MESLGLDTVDFERLNSSVDFSLANMKPAREWRMKMLRRMVGRHYPGEDRAGRQPRPCNLIEVGTDIFSRSLTSHRPQALVTSDYEELMPTAADFECVLNRRIDKMNLRDQLNLCALESLVTIGVMCVGLGIEGKNDSATTFAKHVSFPHLVLDMNAEEWSEQEYIGHDFVVPMHWVKDHPAMDQKARDSFVASTERQWASSSEDWARRRSEQFQDLVMLRQLWLRDQNLLVLIAVEGNTRDPLMVSEWTGPKHGPYLPLYYRAVPGNLLPLSPVATWAELDNIANKGYVKAFEQAMRCKTVGLATSEDAKAIVDAQDGEVKSVTDPNSVVEKSFGGANQNVVASASMAKDMLMTFGGNWLALGGLGPQSGTVGQDQLLAQGASGRMKDMQATMTEFETLVIQDIGFWEWENADPDERFTKTLKGYSYGLPDQQWSKETRKGEFFQMNLSVNPYSKINRSPEEQASALTQLLESVILPSLPYMQQGAPVDWEVYFDLLARFMHLPELRQVIRWPQGDSIPKPSAEMPSMGRNTTRTYQRLSGQMGNTDPLAQATQQFMQTSRPPEQQPTAA